MTLSLSLLLNSLVLFHLNSVSSLKFDSELANNPPELLLSNEEPVYDVYLSSTSSDKNAKIINRDAATAESDSESDSKYQFPVATGRYWEIMNQTGWSVLDLHTNATYSDQDQSYGAGYLEGYLTSTRIAQYARNAWGRDFIEFQNLRKNGITGKEIKKVFIDGRESLEVPIIMEEGELGYDMIEKYKGLLSRKCLEKIRDQQIVDHEIIVTENPQLAYEIEPVLGKFNSESKTALWNRLEGLENKTLNLVASDSHLGIGLSTVTSNTTNTVQASDNCPTSINRLPLPRSVKKWLTKNTNWMKRHIKESDVNEDSPYWQVVSSLLSQLSGMADGYNEAQIKLAKSESDPPPLLLSWIEILTLNLLDTEMEDMLKAIGFWEEEEESEVTTVETLAETNKKLPKALGHCSALVALSNDHSDLFATHSEFDLYRGMIKIVKYMDMPLSFSGNQHISYTSYFGSLWSGEDWYRLAPSGLTVFETTNNNENMDILKKYSSDPGGGIVLSWMRAMIANKLAQNGDYWTELQVKYNSGMYNNQWIVVDFKRFKPQESTNLTQLLEPGLLWISETMPGYSIRKDVTQVLREQKQWSSYNVPYFKELLDLSEAYPKGYTDSYFNAPRAKMFARSNGTLNSLNPDVFHLIRQNNYKTFPNNKFNNSVNVKESDPLLKGNPCNGIASRCDLNDWNSEHYSCFGEMNAKAVSYSESNLLNFFAILGPTHDTQPRFRWSEQDQSNQFCRQPLGMVDEVAFNWWHMKMPSSNLETIGSSSDFAPKNTVSTSSEKVSESHSDSVSVSGETKSVTTVVNDDISDDHFKSTTVDSVSSSIDKSKTESDSNSKYEDSPTVVVVKKSISPESIISDTIPISKYVLIPVIIGFLFIITLAIIRLLYKYHYKPKIIVESSESMTMSTTSLSAGFIGQSLAYYLPLNESAPPKPKLNFVDEFIISIGTSLSPTNRGGNGRQYDEI